MENEYEKAAQLANKILLNARNTLLVHLRFMDKALSNLQVIPAMTPSLTTNGIQLGFSPYFVLNSYQTARELPNRNYLHVVLQCIFKHPFLGSLTDQRLWNLSCDIAVENIINEMGLPCVQTAKAAQQLSLVQKLAQSVSLITAEKVYDYFQNHPLSEAQYQEWEALFCADDHSPWYAPPTPDGGSNSGEDEQNSDGGNSGENEPDGDGNNENDGENERDNMQRQMQAMSGVSPETEKMWSDVGHSTQMDLETFSKEQGDDAGAMMQNLREVTREKYDYAAFLKKFAVMHEAMQINDDEFDYVFYTYGLQLYRNMPLIESLEYKDVKLIREFVIVIDTSGSVSGELVQTFVQKTYNILKSTESFCKRINLHIIQCDAEIQEHVQINTQDEFDEYIKHMKLKGFGGTDFRPAFALVDRLVQESANKMAGNLSTYRAEVYRKSIRFFRRHGRKSPNSTSPERQHTIL